MQILRATSRSINTDRFYQTEQQKRKCIHLQKVKQLSSIPLKPLKVDLSVQKQLKKAKSAAKIFQKEQQKFNMRLQNKSLLTKLVNVQSTLKPFLKNQILEANKTHGISSNWLSRKKQTEKVKKQNQLLNKRWSQIANSDVKDMKKKIREGIKQYLELRENIRKMKPPQTAQDKKRQRSTSLKIKMRLPLSMNQLENDEQIAVQKKNKIKDKKRSRMKIHSKTVSQPNQQSVGLIRLRQLRKTDLSGWDSTKRQKKAKLILSSIVINLMIKDNKIH